MSHQQCFEFAREEKASTNVDTEKIAATFGPAAALPMWIQFLLPIAMGRMEFSARLLDNSSSGYWRNRVSLFHSASV